MGKIFKQYNSKWSKKNYNGSSTIGAAACGPFSVANLIVEFNPNIDPMDVVKYMQKHGYAIRNNGTAWAGIPAAMKAFGMEDVKNVASMSDVFKYLSKGYDAVFLFRGGSRGGITWTTAGHYVAVTGYKEENGKHKLYTKDSGGRDHDGWYCYETQMKGLIPQVWVGKAPKKTTTTDTTTKKVYPQCIDVSDHQGKIDWSKVNVKYVILRAGYGKGNIDKRFVENIKGAIKAGKVIGIYWFSYAYTKSMAEDEGKYVCAAIAPYKEHIKLPVYFDFEYDSMNYARKNGKNPSKSLITAMTKVFIQEVEKNGYIGGFYYNYDYKKNHYDMDELKAYSHWYALYSDEIPECDIQQYSSKGKVSGISGKVDMNRIINMPAKKTPDPEPEKKKTVWKKGDSGEKVKSIQKKLNEVNLMKSIPKDKQKGVFKVLVVDGVFGDLTEAAVKLFQCIENIDVDGKAGPITLGKLDSAKWTSARGAVNFAVAVARDNSFAYGSGQRAHRSGCYFCGTNTGPKKKKKEKSGEPHYVTDSEGNKHTYEKTYCCNTLITAAYAHGAGDATILKICEGGSCCGMNPKDWTKSKNIKHKGTCKGVKYDDIKMGDIIMADEDRGAKHHHVFMAIGHGRFVEASGGTWSTKSISVKDGLKSRYSDYASMKGTDVCRYAG